MMFRKIKGKRKKERKGGREGRREGKRKVGQTVKKKEKKERYVHYICCPYWPRYLLVLCDFKQSLFLLDLLYLHVQN